MSKSDPVFKYICYGGTMVKRINFESYEQYYQCPHAGDELNGFPACKTCDGKLEGIVNIKIMYK